MFGIVVLIFSYLLKRLIEKEKITDWTGVPTLITDLLECLRLHPHVDLSSLKKVGGGGAQVLLFIYILFNLTLPANYQETLVYTCIG